MPAPCRNCTAPLDEVKYQPTVRCRHCEQEQENPTCLAVDDEVMVAENDHFQLAVVTACRGPKSIDLMVDKKPLANAQLVDLVPVLRAGPDLKKNTLIFHKSMMPWWERTWTAKDADAGSIMLKHDNPSFQDSFFDKPAGISMVRVPAIAAAAKTRSTAQGFIDNFKSDIIGSSITLGVKLVFALIIGSVVLGIGCSVVRGLLH